MEDLEPGELLLGHEGPVAVQCVRPLPSSGRVYNLEIHGQQVYRIGPAGVLVHNNGGLCPPKYGGRRGNQNTREHLEQVCDDFLEEHPKYEHIAGGRDRITGEELPEEYIPPISGGRKEGSYAALTFEGPDGDRIRINTVDTRKDGTLTKREQDALERMKSNTNGGEIKTYPKPK